MGETRFHGEEKNTPVDEFAGIVTRVFGEEVFKVEHLFGELVVWVKAEDIRFACQRAKEDQSLDLNYLRCLSCVDYLDHFELVYHLYSINKHHKLVFKCQVSKDRPSIDSVTAVWQGADWHEREAADLFGIIFDGHPNPKPLLLEDVVKERPFLKGYPLVEPRRSRRG